MKKIGIWEALLVSNNGFLIIFATSTLYDLFFDSQTPREKGLYMGIISGALLAISIVVIMKVFERGNPK